MNNERALRRIRQRIFDYPPNRQATASRVLHKLKARILRTRHHSRDYHPFYACE